MKTIEEMMKKGKWIITLNDNTKWIVDFDNNLFDNYNWYKKVGTLESELNWQELKKQIKYMKRFI